MKNRKTISLNKASKKFLSIFVSLVFILSLGLSSFASAGYDRGHSYVNTTPDSGYIEVQSIDYAGYAVNRFILGGYSTNEMYPIDGITVSIPVQNGISWSMEYIFGHSLGGVRLSFPISFVRISGGEIIPDSFASITFNKDIYMVCRFKVLEEDGTLAGIVQDRYISANSPIEWLDEIPNGINIIVDYEVDITFSTTPQSDVVMTYSDSYTGSYSNTLESLVQLNNFDAGYNQGYIDGKTVGENDAKNIYYRAGYNDGMKAGPLKDFGTFISNTIGGFLDTELFGEGTFKIGDILVVFVTFSFAIWLLKLLAGG